MPDAWLDAMAAGDLATALRLAEQANDPTRTVLTLKALGRRHDEASEDALAELAFARALALADSLAEDPELLRAHTRLAANVYLSRVNRYPEAIARIREALVIVEAARGPNHPETADILIALGYRCLEGEAFIPSPLERAEHHLARAIAILSPLPAHAARLETARSYLVLVHRHRELYVVRDLRRLLSEFRISIAFVNGIATLKGRVATEADRARAAQLATMHPAVRAVTDELHVEA